MLRMPAAIALLASSPGLALAAPPITVGYSVVHVFGGAGDPGSPRFLTSAHGVLWGGTSSGTVFSVTTSGTEKIACTVAPGQSAGIEGVTLLGGEIFGTAAGGGSHGQSVAFKCRPDGTVRVLHGFRGDDGTPSSTLLPVSGLLYGETLNGGANNTGTIYTLTPHGQETAVFDIPSPEPADGLTALGGALFGVSVLGNAVWSYVPGGAYTNLHNFNYTDGYYPEAPLTAYNGVLYGVTTEGGANGYGTIFSITPSGSFTLLASLPKGLGAACWKLVRVGQSFYGVTSGGGTNFHGAVFRYKLGGHVEIVHSFAGGQDGETPFSDLARIGNTLYGTTLYGGANNQGTLFAITPP